LLLSQLYGILRYRLSLSLHVHLNAEEVINLQLLRLALIGMVYSVGIELEEGRFPLLTRLRRGEGNKKVSSQKSKACPELIGTKSSLPVVPLCWSKPLIPIGPIVDTP
jgi:hypothetical protein